MKKLSLEQNLQVPTHFSDDFEIDVEIDFSVSNDDVIYFGPMDCSGSIHKNRDLNELKQYFIGQYEKQGYTHVKVTEVRVAKDLNVKDFEPCQQ